ncbi:uncharacterized protein LOC132003218 [Mustela nigripes]|uniref:uncharacterized protein LOC132003218 n=1 Tax=Mustela nigripes TaxID=77151 RepID=UPI002814E48A|nr:uncharacterized protein LOC132003218 [Mustela nigripes]
MSPSSHLSPSRHPQRRRCSRTRPTAQAAEADSPGWRRRLRRCRAGAAVGRADCVRVERSSLGRRPPGLCLGRARRQGLFCRTSRPRGGQDWKPPPGPTEHRAPRAASARLPRALRCGGAAPWRCVLALLWVPRRRGRFLQTHWAWLGAGRRRVAFGALCQGAPPRPAPASAGLRAPRSRLGRGAGSAFTAAPRAARGWTEPPSPSSPPEDGRGRVARQGQLRPQEERRGGKVAARSFTSEPRRPPGPRSARAEKESSLHPTWGLNSPLGSEVPHSSQEPAIRPPIYLFKGQSLSLNGLHPLGDQQRSSGGPGGWRSFPPASLSPAQATPVPHATKRFPLPQLRVSPGTKVEMPSPGGQSLGSSSFYPPFLARLDRGLSAFLGRPFQSFLKRVPDRAATPSAHGRRRRDPLIPFGRLLRLAAGGVQLGVRERAWRAAPRTIMRRWLNNF